jgi:flagellar hook protein FlgE
MRQVRFVPCLLLLASGCVNITVNNGYGAGGSSVVHGLGGTIGSTRGSGGAAGAGGDALKPAKATDSITLRGNLDQSAFPITWDPASPKTTSNFTTSLTVYDSVGKAIQLDIYFIKDNAALLQPGDSGYWTYHVMTDGMNLAFRSDGVTAASPGSDSQIAVGTLRFDTARRLVSNTTTNQGFYPEGAASPQVLTFVFGKGTAAGGSGLDGLTQYAATSAVSFVDQSGSAAVTAP